MERQSGTASLITSLLWLLIAGMPVPAVRAQQFSLLGTPVKSIPLTSSTPNVPSTLRCRTLRAEGTCPRAKHAAELRMKQAGTIVATRPEEWPIPRAGSSLQLAPGHNSRISHRLPELTVKDTAFSTQVRMPIADLWGGRLQMDGFHLEVSANSVFRGLPQSSDLWWVTPASLTLRSATSYGIALSFHKPILRVKTLCRCLFGGGGK